MIKSLALFLVVTTISVFAADSKEVIKQPIPRSIIVYRDHGDIKLSVAQFEKKMNCPIRVIGGSIDYPGALQSIHAEYSEEPRYIEYKDGEKTAVLISLWQNLSDKACRPVQNPNREVVQTINLSQVLKEMGGSQDSAAAKAFLAENAPLFIEFRQTIVLEPRTEPGFVRLTLDQIGDQASLLYRGGSQEKGSVYVEFKRRPLLQAKSSARLERLLAETKTVVERFLMEQGNARARRKAALVAIQENSSNLYSTENQASRDAWDENFLEWVGYRILYR